MRNHEPFCSLSLLFAACALAAAIGFESGAAVAETHLPSTASSSITSSKTAKPSAAGVTEVAPQTKGAESQKPSTPVYGRVSDAR